MHMLWHIKQRHAEFIVLTLNNPQKYVAWLCNDYLFVTNSDMGAMEKALGDVGGLKEQADDALQCMYEESGIMPAYHEGQDIVMHITEVEQSLMSSPMLCWDGRSWVTCTHNCFCIKPLNMTSLLALL